MDVRALLPMPSLSAVLSCNFSASWVHSFESLCVSSVFAWLVSVLQVYCGIETIDTFFKSTLPMFSCRRVHTTVHFLLIFCLNPTLSVCKKAAAAAVVKKVNYDILTSFSKYFKNVSQHLKVSKPSMCVRMAVKALAIYRPSSRQVCQAVRHLVSNSLSSKSSRDKWCQCCQSRVGNRTCAMFDVDVSRGRKK